MLAWFEEFDNGRQKPEIMVMTSGGELFTDYSDHPRKLVTLNLYSNQQAPDVTSFFPVVMPTASSLPERLLSEKSGRCSIAAD